MIFQNFQRRPSPLSVANLHSCGSKPRERGNKRVRHNWRALRLEPSVVIVELTLVALLQRTRLVVGQGINFFTDYLSPSVLAL